MRIWFQSFAPLGRDPLWESYEQVQIRHAQKVARPGTTVDVHGGEVFSTAIDRSVYVESLSVPIAVNNAIKAEKEGYDAFALMCMMDTGFLELKEVVDIPVAFSLESACHVASLLAPKFAFIGHSAHLHQRATEIVKHYGLGEKLVPSGYFTTTMEALQDGFKDPEPVLKEVRKVAKRAAEQGADMLISTCGCTNMILVAHGIKEIEGTPVMDSMGVVIKMAELLVDLKKMGLDRVNRGLYSRLTKEELSSIRKLYKVE